MRLMLMSDEPEDVKRGFEIELIARFRLLEGPTYYRFGKRLQWSHYSHISCLIIRFDKHLNNLIDGTSLMGKFMGQSVKWRLLAIYSVKIRCVSLLQCLLVMLQCERKGTVKINGGAWRLIAIIYELVFYILYHTLNIVNLQYISIAYRIND